jgi:hypothetical protein
MTSFIQFGPRCNQQSIMTSFASFYLTSLAQNYLMCPPWIAYAIILLLFSHDISPNMHFVEPSLFYHHHQPHTAMQELLIEMQWLQNAMQIQFKVVMQLWFHVAMQSALPSLQDLVKWSPSFDFYPFGNPLHFQVWKLDCPSIYKTSTATKKHKDDDMKSKKKWEQGLEYAKQGMRTTRMSIM